MLASCCATASLPVFMPTSAMVNARIMSRSAAHGRGDCKVQKMFSDFVLLHAGSVALRRQPAAASKAKLCTQCGSSSSSWPRTLMNGVVAVEHVGATASEGQETAAERL
jgi:hypothetical protein